MTFQFKFRKTQNSINVDPCHKKKFKLKVPLNSKGKVIFNYNIGKRVNNLAPIRKRKRGYADCGNTFKGSPDRYRFGISSSTKVKINKTYSNTYPIRCNFTQFIYVWKLLYMLRLVPPPIIRNTYNCIYSIWYLSDRYCYLPLAAGSGNGLTNTRCCRYSCMHS